MNGTYRLILRMWVLMAVLCVSVVLLGGLPALAKNADGPSAAETVKFIQETMLSCGTFRTGEKDFFGMKGVADILTKRVDVKQPWTFEVEGRFRAVISGGYQSDPRMTGLENRYVFDLARMNPEVAVGKDDKIGDMDFVKLTCIQGNCVRSTSSTFKPYKFSSRIECNQDVTDCRNKMRAEMLEPIEQNELEPPGTIYQSSFSQFTCDEQTAQSLAKAFRHAITLAGSKKPLF